MAQFFSVSVHAGAQPYRTLHPFPSMFLESHFYLVRLPCKYCAGHIRGSSFDPSLPADVLLRSDLFLPADLCYKSGCWPKVAISLLQVFVFNTQLCAQNEDKMFENFEFTNENLSAQTMDLDIDLISWTVPSTPTSTTFTDNFNFAQAFEEQQV